MIERFWHSWQYARQELWPRMAEGTASPGEHSLSATGPSSGEAGFLVASVHYTELQAGKA